MCSKKWTPFLFTISLEFPLSSLTPFSTFLTDVSSSSFSPPPETSRRVLLWLFRLCSIRTSPISWRLKNSLISFLQHTLLFSTHNWGWNMQCQLETCQRCFTFSLASSLIIIMTFVHIHTPAFLLPKNYSEKAMSWIKKVLKSNAFWDPQ